MAKKGHKVSEETRHKISLALVGTKRSIESVKKMALANTGKKGQKKQKKECL